jgi:hypothetical protein
VTINTGAPWLLRKPESTDPLASIDDQVRNLADDVDAALDALLAGTGAASAAWLSFNPVYSSSTGALGSASGALKYRRLPGNLVVWTLNVSITAVGTGSGALRFTLPVNAHADSTNMGSGRESASTGAMVQVTRTSANQCQVIKYDNTDVVFAGRNFNLSGFYQAA